MTDTTMLDDYHTSLIRYAGSMVDASYSPAVAVETAAYVLWVQGSYRGGLAHVKNCMARRQEDKRYDTIVGNIVFAVQSGGFKPDRWSIAS